MAQLAQQMYQMFMANMQQEMATGYVTPSDKPPNKSDAYNAIYQSRPDLQAQHQDKYGDWSVTRYMEHWWEGSGEMREGRHWTDPTTGREWVNTSDVTQVQFAIARGFLNPGPGEEGDYGMAPSDPMAGDWQPPLKGNETEAEIAALYAAHVPDDAPWRQWPEKQKTLDREAFEAGQEQWQQEFLRAQGLDEEAIRQFNEGMKLQRDQYDTAVVEANRQFLRAQGLDEEDMRRWEAGQEQLKEATAEDKRRWNETFAREQGLDEEAIRQFGEQMTLSYYQADQAQSQFEAEHLRLMGLDEQQALQFQQTHQLARDQFDVGNQQWQQQFGLEQAYFDEDKMRWRSEFDIAERQWDAEFLRQQGLDEESVRQWEAEQDRLDELSGEDKRRWNEEFLRQQGLDTETMRQFDATHELARLNYEAGNRQWQRQFGLEERQFDRETGQWEQEFGLEERRFGLEEGFFGLAGQEQTEVERYNRLQQELEMMGLMTQQQGPRNWLQYGALQRQAQPGGRPDWEQRLLTGAGFAPFQGGGPMPVATEGVQFGPQLEAGWQQNLMDNAMQQYIQPHQIGPQQWANMAPSEREQLMGLVEMPQQLGGYGGWAEDYLDRMMKGWPTGGNVQGVSAFTGW